MCSKSKFCFLEFFFFFTYFPSVVGWIHACRTQGYGGLIVMILSLIRFLIINWFLYFWPCWVFVAVHGLSLAVVGEGSCSNNYCLLHSAGFSLWWPLLLWTTDSRVHRLSSCGSWALGHRLSSCGAWGLVALWLWNLSGPGIKPVGIFLTTGPSGESIWSDFSATDLSMILICNTYDCGIYQIDFIQHLLVGNLLSWRDFSIHSLSLFMPLWTPGFLFYSMVIIHFYLFVVVLDPVVSDLTTGSPFQLATMSF